MWMIVARNDYGPVLATLASIRAAAQPPAVGVVIKSGATFIRANDDALGEALPRGWVMLEELDDKGPFNALNAGFQHFPDEPFYGYLAAGFMPDKHWPGAMESVEAGQVSYYTRGQEPHDWLAASFHGDVVRALGFLALPECWGEQGFSHLWSALAQLDAVRPRVLYWAQGCPAPVNDTDPISVLWRELDEQKCRFDFMHYQRWVYLEAEQIRKRMIRLREKSAA